MSHMWVGVVETVLRRQYSTVLMLVTYYQRLYGSIYGLYVPEDIIGLIYST